jgi:ketosteroid isomerase-like protein
LRFQTTETVPISDAEKVLHALEASLRELSDELERSGPRITLYGLGPSPRARNYRDIAVFDVTADSGSTTIRSVVSFQASALLGPAGQEEVVRSKLDYAFDQMRMQLGVPEIAREASPETVVPAIVGEPQQNLEEEPDFGPSLAPSVDAEVESSVWSIPPEATDELPVQIEDELDKPAPVSSEPEFGKPKREHSGAERTETPFSVWAASLRSVQVPSTPSVELGVGQSAVVDEQETEAPRLRFGAEAHRTNLPIVLAILLGMAVAAGTVYLYWAGLLHRMELGFRHPKTAAPASQPTPPPVQAPVQAAVVAAPAPPAPPRHEEAEPKVWLEQWADAMRSRDADLQASFYADPLARFQDDTNVSKEALATFFRSQIQARNDLWTMRLERVSIDPISSSHVIARVSKHFMELADSASSSEGNQITDRYVRSRLELRRTDGEWKIVSEQDVTPASGTQ